MTNPLWFAMVGGLLLFMGLTSSILKRSPFTASIVYLGAGVLVGPTVLNLYQFNPLQESRLLEMLYYLMYAIQHGLLEDLALQLIQLTLIVVTLSILLHGISIKPLTSRVRKTEVKE